MDPNETTRGGPSITVVEVGPRDGLQNEPGQIGTADKIAFVEALAAAGLPVIETTSFVNPKAVPQLADAAEVMRGLVRRPGVRYPVLVPNERGMERALGAGADAIALFTSATDAFARANVGTSIEGTFERFAPVVSQARQAGMWIRGYVSVAFRCPFAGIVTPEAAVAVGIRLLELGCAEVAFADTIGQAEPEDVDRMLAVASKHLPVARLALHLHDTAGRALANVDVGLAHGVAVFDGAAGGLGGCPFAPGAPGNLATEALVRHLERRGYRTGVDAEAVHAAAAALGVPNRTMTRAAPGQREEPVADRPIRGFDSVEPAGGPEPGGHDAANGVSRT